MSILNTKKAKGLIFNIFLSCTVFVLEAQAEKEIDTPPAYSIPGTEVHSIHSRLLKRDYDIYIKLPPSYTQESNRRYPIVVVNDSTFSFPIGSSITRLLTGQGEIQDLILIGISYSQGDSPRLSRTRDYTPSYVENCCHGREFQQHSGKSKEYANFLAQEVIPFIDSRYRTQSKNRTLVGYSFSGLLGAYMLIEHPSVFENYILVSPSLWYDKKVIFKLEADGYELNKNLSHKVYLAVGELEQPGKSQVKNDLVGDVSDFHKHLSKNRYPKFDTKLRIVENEKHNTVFPSALTSGLLWLFPDQK